MRRMIALGVSFSLWLSMTSHARAQGTNHAPQAIDVTATSLARVQADWKVTTTLTLQVKDDDSTAWTFTLVHPEALTDADGSNRFDCAGQTSPPTVEKLDLNIPIKQRLLNCRYQPPAGNASGEETFQYVVSDGTSTSQPANIKVTWKSQGLRWELTTNAGSSLTSDNPNAGIPNVIGKTVQDFMFNLDWEIADPRLTTAGLAGRNASLDDIKSGAKRVPTPGLTRNTHFVFHTGIVTQPQAVVAASQGTSSSATTTAGSPAPAAAVAAQRVFTAGAEFNYNAVLPADTGGTYLEIGAMAKGFVDASLEGATTSEEVAGQFLKLARMNAGSGSFRAEAGGRVALKQYHDALRTSIIRTTPDGKEDQISFPKNSDDLIVFEIGYQRNTGVEGLSAAGSTQDRYVIRIMAMPEIPNMPGHLKGMIGLELNGDIRGNSARQVKILYGINLSAIGLGQ